MSLADQQIKLTLAGAPLLVATCFYGANTTYEINWPQRLNFAEFKIKDEALRPAVSDKLAWIKRQYEALYLHKKAPLYAQHVMPYAAKVNLLLLANRSDLSVIAGRLKQIPIDYANSLAQSLEQSLKIETPNIKTVESENRWVQDSQNIRVISAHPLNELELGIPLYYRQQQQAWAASISSWLELSYKQKAEYLSIALKSNPDVHYRLEVICEPQRLLKLVEENIWSIESWQIPSPSFGYELPKRATDGGMMERCFDASYKLYGQIQAVNPELAPLFSLWGHRQRAVVQINGHQIANLQKLNGVDGGFAKAILTKVAEKHPHVVESLEQPGNK